MSKWPFFRILFGRCSPLLHPRRVLGFNSWGPNDAPSDFCFRFSWQLDTSFVFSVVPCRARPNDSTHSIRATSSQPSSPAAQTKKYGKVNQVELSPFLLSCVSRIHYLTPPQSEPGIISKWEVSFIGNTLPQEQHKYSFVCLFWWYLFYSEPAPPLPHCTPPTNITTKFWP